MSRVSGPALGVLLTIVALVSCAELFDDPAQCTTDSDCSKYNGAVCDVTQSVCVVAGDDDVRTKKDGSTDPTSDDSGTSSTDKDAAVIADATDNHCNPTPKGTGVIGVRLDGGALGRSQITGAVTLGCDKDWSLDTLVFVRSGATLTIEAGTTIRAKKGANAGIVVSPGGRIVAEGKRDLPIVFTSDASPATAGDWRGIYILGLAPPAGNAAYEDDPDLAWGGANVEDDSGVLSFVRLEYPRAGLVFAGVGRKTKIDYVQVRKTLDNCFMFFGGRADSKHLVCQFPGDDQFEWWVGAQGRSQFLFGQRAQPQPVYGSGGLLVDDSKPVIYNATLCGEKPPTPVNGYGVLFRDEGTLNLNGAIVTGWFTGLDGTGNVPNAGTRKRSQRGHDQRLHSVREHDQSSVRRDAEPERGPARLRRRQRPRRARHARRGSKQRR
jgi:hypothetical protein